MSVLWYMQNIIVTISQMVRTFYGTIIMNISLITHHILISILWLPIYKIKFCHNNLRNIQNFNHVLEQYLWVVSTN
ncbi:Uncharacterised protein [Mycobacteroides abscessus]|nr:Uncharacterised protein [Mycobacteroides abscessus]